MKGTSHVYEYYMSPEYLYFIVGGYDKQKCLPDKVQYTPTKIYEKWFKCVNYIDKNIVRSQKNRIKYVTLILTTCIVCIHYLYTIFTVILLTPYLQECTHYK